MFEHVGRKFYKSFFNTIFKTLNENKKAYIYRKLNKQQENSSEDKEVNKLNKNYMPDYKISSEVNEYYESVKMFL